MTSDGSTRPPRDLGFGRAAWKPLVNTLLSDLGTAIGAQPAGDFDRNENDLWRRRRDANATIKAYWAKKRDWNRQVDSVDECAKDDAEADRTRVDSLFREPRVAEMTVRTAGTAAAISALRVVGEWAGGGGVTCEQKVELSRGLGWRPRTTGSGYVNRGYVDLLVRGASGALLPIELKFVPAKELVFANLRHQDFRGQRTGAHVAKLERLRSKHQCARALWQVLSTRDLKAHDDNPDARRLSALLDRAGRRQLAAYAGSLMKADATRDGAATGATRATPRTLRGLTLALVGDALLVGECWQYTWPRARDSTATRPAVDAQFRMRYLMRLPDGPVVCDEDESVDATTGGLTDAFAAVSLSSDADESKRSRHRRRIRGAGAVARKQ